MTRPGRGWLLVRLAALGVAASVGFALGGCLLVRPPVTLTSLSPDDRFRVTLVERSAVLDRNFDVRLDDRRDGTRRTVFRSPDEGFPPGSERVVWAADGSRFLLLGRHFHVTDAAGLPSGELAYLMADVHSGRVWCNATQQAEHPGFTVADLRAVRWLGWHPDL